MPMERDGLTGSLPDAPWRDYGLGMAFGCVGGGGAERAPRPVALHRAPAATGGQLGSKRSSLVCVAPHDMTGIVIFVGALCFAPYMYLFVE